MARVRSAFVNVDLTQLATKTVNAEALKSIRLVQASASIETRLVGTVVGVNEAVAAFEAIPAVAGVAAHGVDAFATVAARCRNGTLIDIVVAEATNESQRTSAKVFSEV